MVEESPSEWGPDEVAEWARRSKLSESTIATLSENEIDGPTLVTLTKEDIRQELGIRSLAARRYLWDLIVKLRLLHETSNSAIALDVYTSEVTGLSTSSGPDESGGGAGGKAVHPNVIEVLRSDAEIQRQIIEDHLLAYRIQAGFAIGQQVVEDSELAVSEQRRFDELVIQSECDRHYAATLNTNRRGARSPATHAAPPEPVQTLFGQCITTCLTHKINVADALRTGRIQPRTFDTAGDTINIVSDDESDEEDDDASVISVADLPFIKRCSVCDDTSVKGFRLSCSHDYCVKDMKSFLQRALEDSSLLPLRCCGQAIDTNIHNVVLDMRERKKLKSRTEEVMAKNKMYCPKCFSFINLDNLPTEGMTEISCDCGENLCTSCKTASHPFLTCEANKTALEEGGVDKLLFDLSKAEGWKQCPQCSSMIELVQGCNHMTCAACQHEFCFQCLQDWNKASGVCSSGRCEVWEEDRLYEAGEMRVRQQEEIRQERFGEAERQHRMQQEMRALRANEGCYHDWHKRNGYLGQCERCGYELPCYGMVCAGECGSTVCYTCATFRIPDHGWR